MEIKRLFEKILSIKIENISKKYGDITALKGLDLEIKGGELLILIGPSGSGKTTALKIINRLIEPDSGKIEINGKDLAGFDPVRLRRNIGYVIQQIGLFPHLNIRENIGLIPRLEGWDRDRIDSKVRELLKLVALPENFEKRYPNQLSGGQQQRVGLARAMVMDPYLFLMDEPFGALDPILRNQLQIEFIKIKEKLNRTIVFVTHDIHEAFRLGDRIAIMDQAKLMQLAEPAELVLNPKNSFVSELVSSQKKFLHMDTLKVGDMMLRLDKKHIFDSGTGTTDARAEMIQRNIELAVIVKDSKFMGIVDLGNIYNTGNEAVGDVAEKIPAFEPGESLSGVLAELKKANQTIGVVTSNKLPIGLIITDKLLMQLI